MMVLICLSAVSIGIIKIADARKGNKYRNCNCDDEGDDEDQ